MQWITRQETELEKHHQNILWCSGGAESILQSLGFKGYEDMIQRGRTETESDSISPSLRERVAWQQEWKSLGWEWKKKKPGIRGQKKCLGTYWNKILNKHLESTGVWYLENKTRAFLPFPPRSTVLLALFFRYRKAARLEDKGEQKTLMASPVLASLNHELCLLIGLISMNNVLVFHSAQISLPKAWELACRQTGPLLRLDLCLFSWFSISRGYQLNLYYILQAVSVCVTHKTYLTGTRL